MEGSVIRDSGINYIEDQFTLIEKMGSNAEHAYI